MKHASIKRFPLMMFCVMAVCSVMLFCRTALAAEAEIDPALGSLLVKEISKSIGENPEIVSVRIVKGYDFNNSPGKVEFRSVTPMVYAGKSRFTTTVYIKDKKGISAESVIEVVYDVLVDVYVASKYIQRGNTVADEDFYAVKQKKSRLSRSVALDKSDITGKIAKSSINEGSVILTDYLTSHLTFKRGHKVNVVVEGANMQLSSSGVLKANAVLGGTATVQCESSKKEVTGVLVSPTTVRIKI
ncbi:MAG: flagellar basal body P-ring formation chaperone FlgA [Nitrospiraceae bacterium]|nr:flagellar basal body P-ring formation chaperone FlgA [Nitrospiraceae bacterium]